jgi:hypothetical protein
MHRRSTRGGRRGGIATAAAALCIACGLGLIGTTLASQRPDPQMPPVSVVSETPVAAPEPGDAWFRRLRERDAAEAPQAVTGPVLPASEPVRLAIPSIGVDSALQHLGQDAEGGLEVPAPGPRYDEAAWYRYSPTPGELGPAVLLGHIDSAAGGPSVFFRLGELQAGARIDVTRADGSAAVFVVDAVHRYAKKDFPTQLVYGDIDHAGLRILTCGGAFDRTTRHYLDNIVVFASLVSPGSIPPPVSGP